MADSNPKKPRSKIERLPLGVRKQLFGISLSLLMTLVIAFWAISLQFRKPVEVNQKQEQEMQELQDQLKEILGQTKQSVDELSTQFDALVELASSTPTSTAEMQTSTSSDRETIKEALQEIQNN
jgi:cytoskeletal protein RodZ